LFPRYLCFIVIVARVSKPMLISPHRLHTNLLTMYDWLWVPTMARTNSETCLMQFLFQPPAPNVILGLSPSRRPACGNLPLLPPASNRPATSATQAACAIQDCLSANSYNEAKCQNYVNNLYKCCMGMYRSAESKGMSSEDAKDLSTACPIRSVVERRMKRIESEAGK
jgi:hypothetical protein